MVLYCLLESIDISTVCIIWGAVDICRGINDLYTVFFDGKFEKHEIPDFILAIVDIVLGVILIIKLDDGLNVHLIAATVSVFVFAGRQIFNLIALLKAGKMYE